MKEQRMDRSFLRPAHELEGADGGRPTGHPGHTFARVRGWPHSNSLGWEVTNGLVLLGAWLAIGACTVAGPHPPPTDLGKPVATDTSSAVPARTPKVFFPGELPAWLADPGVNVLAIVTGGEGTHKYEADYFVSYVNLASGEHYDVTVPYAQAIFWLDAHTFGLISQDGKSIYLIDLADGTIEGTPFEQSRYRVLSGAKPVLPQESPVGPMTPLVRIAEAGDDEVTLVTSMDTYSSDLSLYAEIVDEEIHVRETETGALEWDSDPEDRGDASEIESAWSPVKPHELAIVKGIYPDEGSDSFDVTSLVIVDATSGDEVSSFEGDFSSISWSPGGNTILYQLPEKMLPNSQEFTGPPCILDLTTGRSECFREAEEPHFSLDGVVASGRLTGLRWNKVGDGFYYIYRASYSPSNPADAGTPGPLPVISALCYFDISGRDVTCPTAGVSGLEGRVIDRYAISPDGRYAYITIAGHGEGSLDNGHGVLDISSRRFITLPFPSGESLADFDVSPLWRPRSLPQVSKTVRSRRPTEQDVRDIRSIWDLYNLSDNLNLESPGTREFFVEVASAQTLIWPYYWCATDREVLADNLKSMDVEFLIDEAKVPAMDILEYERTSEDWSCHYWATMLSDWEEGEQVALTIRYSFSEAVNDGRTEYRAGDYFCRLNVDIRGE